MRLDVEFKEAILMHKEEQEKSVVITENESTTSILPDAKKVLSKVNVDVQIPVQNKEISVTDNGTYNVAPDSGNLLSGVTIKASNEKLKRMADNSITKITAEDLEGITYTDGCSFAYRQQLAEVELPPTLEEIRYRSFWSCKSLPSITIPPNVRLVSDGAFLNCTKLTTVRMLGTKPPSLRTTSFDSTNLTKIIVPYGCLEIYKTATNWSAWADYMEEE